ncbi:hypothetical protein TI04_08940 [Achromatium sp. WMS2]|nr:hypothetical protein TI04_08940 [Achromatium sp. WMS2]
MKSPNPKSSRDPSIDIVRGIAIFTMFEANFAAVTLAEPYPILLRLYGTFAASTFVLIAGMMVTNATHKPDHKLDYYLYRGGFILLIAALIDMLLWGYYPFWSFDILYLIGLGIPTAYFMSKTHLYVRLIIPITIVTLTPIMQGLLGYTDYPQEVYFSGKAPTLANNPTSVLNHFLVDGWFSLFPWLGMFLLGTLLGDIRRRYANFSKNRIGWIGITILLAGALMWINYPGSLMTRDGYSEMFYEPTIGYVITAIGVGISLLTLVDFNPQCVVYIPLQLLGKNALIMYITHGIIIAYILWPTFANQQLTLWPFLAIYLGISSILLVFAWLMQQLKAYWPEQPLVIKFLLGG